MSDCLECNTCFANFSVRKLVSRLYDVGRMQCTRRIPEGWDLRVCGLGCVLFSCSIFRSISYTTLGPGIPTYNPNLPFPFPPTIDVGYSKFVLLLWCDVLD